MFQLSQTQGEVTKEKQKGVPLWVDTKNAEFRGYKDIWQNTQDKEETNRNNWATVLKSDLAGANCDHWLTDHGPKKPTNPRERLSTQTN